MRQKVNPRQLANYLERAKRALADDQMEIAGQFAKQVLSGDPGNEEAGKILDAAKGKNSKDRGFFGRALGELEGRAAGLLGRGHQAITELEILHKENPTDPTSAQYFAQACLREGRWADGIAAYETAIPHNQSKVGFLLNAAEFFLNVGEPGKAIPVYARLKELRPNDPKMDRGYRNAEAAFYHQREAEINPMQERAAKERENIEKTQLNLETKIEQAIRTFKDDPKNLRNRVWLGELLMERGGKEDLGYAEGVLNDVLKEDPMNAAGALTLAKLYRATERLKEALDLLQRIVGMREDDLSFAEKVMEFEIECCKETLKENPTDGAAGARIKELEGRIASADLDELRQRVRLNPSDPDLALELGDRLAERGEYDEAIRYFQQARRLPQRAFRATKRLADVYVKKGMSALAIKMYEKVLELAPKASHGMTEQKKEILYALGSLLEEEGNIREALRHFEDLYAEDITFKDVGQRYESLFEKRKAQDQAEQ